MDLIRLSHCVYECDYQIVLVTKYRRKIFNDGIFAYLRQNTARELKRKFPFLKNVYWGTDAIWSEGYFASTVEADETVIQAYIEEQGKKDAGQNSSHVVTSIGKDSCVESGG